MPGPRVLCADLACVGDAKVRAQALAAAARIRAHPLTARVLALLFLRIAPWQPLVAEPGTTYHHSNIGWNAAGAGRRQGGREAAARALQEAAPLRALTDGTLVDRQAWRDLYGTPVATIDCGGSAYIGEGAGDGYRSYVRYDATGDRVAVLLLNRNRGNAAAALRLFCAA